MNEPCIEHSREKLFEFRKQEKVIESKIWRVGCWTDILSFFIANKWSQISWRSSNKGVWKFQMRNFFYDLTTFTEYSMPSRALKSLYICWALIFDMWKVLHVFSRFQWNAGLRGQIHLGISTYTYICPYIWEFFLKLKVYPTKIFGDISVFVRFFFTLV